MRHRGYDKKEKWYKDGYMSCKAKQVEMLKRNYTEYCKDDWILWIVPDLFHNYNLLAHTGIISIKKKDGSLIQVPFILRTPYPNKLIKQLSMKCGRKRLYGIPLLFKTFEELCEVDEITIRWDIYEGWAFKASDKAVDLHTHTLIVKYVLSFKENAENSDYRFFTLFSKDNVYDVYEEKDIDRIREYYNEFDIAMNVVGNLMCDEEKWEVILGDTFTLKDKTEEDIESLLTEEEQKIVDKLVTVIPDKEKIKELLKIVTVKSEVQWQVSYYERTEILTAEYMADILPESCFGFSEVE